MLITNNAFRTTDLQSARSEQTREKDAVRQAKAADSGSSEPAGDQVALSGAGSGAVGEVQVSLRALRSSPASSAERVEQAKNRLETGFYDQPEVVREVASRVGEALRGLDAG